MSCVGVVVGVLALGDNSKSKSQAAAAVVSQSGVYFQENFADPAHPIVNTTGAAPHGVQACNWGFPAPAPNCGGTGSNAGGGGKWFGNWLPAKGANPLPVLGGTQNYATLDLTVPGSCPTSTGGTGSCRLEAVDNDSPTIQGTWQQGQTTYHSFAFWVPSGGLPANLSPSGYKIAGLHGEGQLNGEPVQIGLFHDHVNLWGDMGSCGSGWCQWHIKADDNVGAWPPGSTFHLPAMHIIPSGGFVNGAWNEIILGVKWESNATGSVDAWYKASTGSTWHHSPGSTTENCASTGAGTCPFPLTNVATVQYPAGGKVANYVMNFDPLFYGPGVKTDTRLNEAGWADGYDFSSVAKTVP